ncbi:MAG: sigma-70 family RNA polymerase sigma factor [Phycisphaerales bacterium]|nr:sigma-70 family RNA polymerase sigma factor [Phycisphaerales bacterium]
MPPCIDDVAALTRRIASGDTEAFADFYSLWFDDCVSQARRMTGLDESACLDVVQEAMLKAATRMPVMGEQVELEKWMRRIMINGARDRIRREMRRARHEAVERTMHTTESHADTESRSELQARISDLDAESAQLLQRRFDLGWTLERIGREIGLRPGAVDGRIKRLLRRLGGELGGGASEQGEDA